MSKLVDKLLGRLGLLRLATASLVILVVMSGEIGKLTYGVMCSLDVWIITVTDPVGPVLRWLGIWRASIAATCPLGYLERSLASRELLPQWPSFLLILLSVILLGRVFCGWICPATIMRRVFGEKTTLNMARVVASKRSVWERYSPYAVLGGVLLASFVFQFPVFCFFCPIGVFFAGLYAVLRLVSPDPLSLELLVFPLLLFVELRLLKSWCRSICPVGALLSIFGNLNRIFVPAVNLEKCLTSKGANCGVCERACPEGIDLTKIRSNYSPNSCTKCLECYVKCPKGAIEFPVLK